MRDLLLGIALFGIVALSLIWGWPLVERGWAYSNWNRTVAEITETRNAIRARSFQADNKYGTAEYTNTTLIAKNLIPASARLNATTLQNAWKGSIQVFGTNGGDALRFVYANVNALGCVDFLTNLSVQMGVLGVRVGSDVSSVSSQTQVSVPQNLNAASALCGDTNAVEVVME